MIDIIHQIVDSLGVDEEQAERGVGLLLKFYQEKLSPGDFIQIADMVPRIEDLINAAPEVEGIWGASGALASAFRGKAEGMSNLANIAAGFSELGMDSEMMSTFITLILDFFHDKGGCRVKSILEHALSPE